MKTKKYTFNERELSLMARFTQECMDFMDGEWVINHNYQDEIDKLMGKLKERDISLRDEDLYREKEGDEPLLYIEHKNRYYFPDLLPEEELKALCKEEYEKSKETWIKKEFKCWEDFYKDVLDDLR